MTDKEQKIVFGHNLKHWLTLREVKQVELAEKLGVTEGAVAQWVAGRTMPTMSKIQKITDILNINKSDLLDDRTGQEEKDEADALRDRVYAKSPALFDLLDKASPEEIKQIEKIVGAIIDE
ncbi:MAG: helix-turn-helix transcriptional regulator [Oscillospiraceae bacterium]|nr:helix-turn-helix transcriptional regulator [Oscillospiraceae bacterium]